MPGVDWARPAAEECTRIAFAEHDPEVVAALDRYDADLILRPVSNYEVRGFDIVLRFFD